MAGDHLAYLIGRSAAGRIEAIPPDSRRGRAIAGAKRLLETRGGMALVLVLRRPVARWLGAGAAYALWALPVLRLVLPPVTLPPRPAHLPPAR